jgi:hypothetical protein
VSALPSNSDVDLFCYCNGIIDLDAKISDGALNLGVPQQQLDRPQIACSPIDQGRFRAPERMCSEQARIQANAGRPGRDQPSVLASTKVGHRASSAGKNVSARRLAGGSQIIVDSLSRRLRQLKFHWTACLLLSHRGTVNRIAAWCNIVDLKRYHVTAA